MKPGAIVFLLVGLAIFICLSLFTSKREVAQRFNEDRAYFSTLPLELTGKAYSKEVFGHAAGVLYLDSVTSNIAYYNPFEKREDKFFCYIKDRKAEIYEGGLTLINTGDSVIVSTRRDSIFIYRSEKKIASWRLSLLNADSYFQRIKEMHHANY